MATVTQRIDKMKQPRGGYIKPGDFVAGDLEDANVLNEHENVHGSLIGIVVDYLTRFLNGTPVEGAFGTSLKGALTMNKFALADEFLSNIQGADHASIENACKLAGFDVVFRAGKRNRWKVSIRMKILFLILGLWWIEDWNFSIVTVLL